MAQLRLDLEHRNWRLDAAGRRSGSTKQLLFDTNGFNFVSSIFSACICTFSSFRHVPPASSRHIFRWLQDPKSHSVSIKMVFWKSCEKFPHLSRFSSSIIAARFRWFWLCGLGAETKIQLSRSITDTKRYWDAVLDIEYSALLFVLGEHSFQCHEYFCWWFKIIFMYVRQHLCAYVVAGSLANQRCHLDERHQVNVKARILCLLVLLVLLLVRGVAVASLSKFFLLAPLIDAEAWVKPKHVQAQFGGSHASSKPSLQHTPEKMH